MALGESTTRWSAETLLIDGVRTSYTRAGSGETVVLLHGGEFGGASRWSWDRLLPLLSIDHDVIAIDWLGYGGTDKLHDFTDPLGRMTRHMARTLEVLDVGAVHVVGNSMGGALALMDAATEAPALKAVSLVSISGGGPQQDNEARASMVDYDGSVAGMRRLLNALFHDAAIVDDAYVAARHEASITPGAWEAVAAARLRSPERQSRATTPRQDTTPYERIQIPVLIVAGADDQLKPPGYERHLAARIPRGSSITIPRCGHCPNIEKPVELVESLRTFWRGLSVSPGEGASL